MAAELFRVAKPGGVVAMANYTQDGFFGRLGSIVAATGPPSLLPSPFLWADPPTVGERFDGRADDVRVVIRSATFEFNSIHEGWDSLERANGPLKALLQLSPPDAYADTRERGQALMAELNRAEDGRLAINWTYALVVATRAG